MSLAVLAAAALVASSIAVAGTARQSSASKLSGTVTVWDFQYTSPFWGKALKQLDQAFMKKYPGVKIKHVGQPFNGYDQLLQTAFSSRTGPDVVMLLPAAAGVTKWQKTLEKLNSRVTPQMQKDLKGWPMVSDGFSPRKGIYGIPTGIQGDGPLYYNKSLYSKAGLNPNRPPTTYPELVAHLKALKAAGIPGLCNGNKEGIQHYWMFSTLWPGVAAPRDTLALIQGNIKFTDDRVRAIVQQHYDLYRQGLTIDAYQSTPMWPDAESMFRSGKCGVFRGLTSAAASWVQFNESLGQENVGVILGVGTWRNKPLYLPYDTQVAWSITNYSKVKDAAFEYVKFLTGTHGASVQLRVGGLIPNNKTVKIPKNLPPQPKLFIEAVKTNPTGPPAHAVFPQEILAVWGPELQQVFAGKQTVAEALAKVEAARK